LLCCTEHHLNTGGTVLNRAFEATPILAISHNLAASRNLRRSSSTLFIIT
jgi:hypothetical protein